MNVKNNPQNIYKYLWLTSFILVAVGAAHRIVNFDFWWHIASARYLLTSGQFPRTDVFNFTSNNTPWFDPTWLAQILFYLAYKWGDAPLVIMVKSLIVTATFFLLYKNIGSERRNSLPAIAFFLAAFAGSRYRFVLRPHIFFYFHTLALLYLLKRVGDGIKPGATFSLLFFLTLSWVNTHGSVIFAYIICGIFIADQMLKCLWRTGEFSKLKKYLLALLIVIAVSMLNPYTYQVITYPLNIQAQASQIASLTEYRPPGPAEFAGPLGLFLIVSPLILIRLYQTGNCADILLLVFFGAAGLKYVRFSGLFLLVAAPIYVNNLDYGFFEFKSRAGKIITFLTIVVLGVIFLKPQLIDTRLKQIAVGVDRDLFPRKAARFIKNNLAGRRGLNVYRWGGYLAWELYPGSQTFIDGRQLPDNAPYLEYSKAFEAKNNFSRLVEKYRLDYVLLDRLPPGVEQFEQSFFPVSGWRLVYWDKMSVIYLRNTGENRELIEREQFRYVHPMQSSNDYLVKMFQDNPAEVLAELNRSLAVDPENARAYFLRGFLEEISKEYSRAASDYLNTLKHNPWFFQASYNLARIYQFHLNDEKKAAEYFLLTLKIKPGHRASLNSLAQIELKN